MNELVLSIAILCGLDDLSSSQAKQMPEYKKIKCIDYYVNCAIGKGGNWTKKDIQRCKMKNQN